jgi:hypothetical protein
MKRINPLTILISWVAGCSVFALTVMVILGKTTPGGEQAPLTFLGKFIYVIVYGLLILSILTIFLFRKWSKKYWIIQAILISLCCYLIVSGERNNADAAYSFTRVDTTIGNKQYIKQYEYYDNRSLRSISFFYNNKKDSIWTIYSESGKVISSLRYKEGSLVETLK